MDVIQRALKLFDGLIVAVADGPHKKPFFPLSERLAMVEESVAGLDRITVKPLKGLLVDFARENQAQVVVRGLRAVSDFEDEFQMATVNRRLGPGLETVFVMTSEKFFYLSSSVVRELAFLGGNVGDFVPAPVAERLKNRRKQV